MTNDLVRNAIYYLEAFRKRPLWTIVPAAVAFAAAIAVIFSLPRSYQSEALLMIETRQSASSLVPTTVANEQLQFVEQRVLARKNLLALAAQFDLFPGLRQTMSDTMLAELVRRHITINTVAAEPSERYAGTSAMRIGFRSDKPAQASAVTARLIEMIVDENRGLRIQRAAEMTEFLQREAKELTDRMGEREGEWRTYLTTNAEAAPARIESLENELQDKEREVAGQAQAISTLVQETRLSEAELRLGAQRSETATEARRRLTELESELAAKSVTYSIEHPDIRSLTQRISSLKQQMVQTSAGSPANAALSPELALVAERIAISKQRHGELVTAQSETARRIAELRAIIASAPAVQAQMDAIGRERDGLRRAVDDMNGRLATAKTSERLERSNSGSHVQIIEQPDTPRYPVSPNRTRLLAIALAAAAGLGIAGLYVGDAMRRQIRGSFDLQNELAGSTLVLIPHWRPEARRSFFDFMLNRIPKADRRGRAAVA